MNKGNNKPQASPTITIDPLGFISLTQPVLLLGKYRKLFTETNSGVSWYVGNGTTANGFLPGNAGDFLLKGAANKPEYCTGGTTWVAVV